MAELAHGRTIGIVCLGDSTLGRLAHLPAEQRRVGVSKGIPALECLLGPDDALRQTFDQGRDTERRGGLLEEHGDHLRREAVEGLVRLTDPHAPVDAVERRQTEPRWDRDRCGIGEQEGDRAAALCRLTDEVGMEHVQARFHRLGRADCHERTAGAAVLEADAPHRIGHVRLREKAVRCRVPLRQSPRIVDGHQQDGLDPPVSRHLDKILRGRRLAEAAGIPFGLSERRELGAPERLGIAAGIALFLSAGEGQPLRVRPDLPAVERSGMCGIGEDAFERVGLVIQRHAVVLRGQAKGRGVRDRLAAQRHERALQGRDPFEHGPSGLLQRHPRRLPSRYLMMEQVVAREDDELGRVELHIVIAELVLLVAEGVEAPQHLTAGIERVEIRLPMVEQILERMIRTPFSHLIDHPEPPLDRVHTSDSPRQDARAGVGTWSSHFDCRHRDPGRRAARVGCRG